MLVRRNIDINKTPLNVDWLINNTVPTGAVTDNFQITMQ